MKAIVEAESYDGPSIIMAYSPCINQGILAGMGKSQEEEKLAVQSGYWPLYRYNPALNRITSYNVCYTKLLRIKLKKSDAKSRWPAGFLSGIYYF